MEKILLEMNRTVRDGCVMIVCEGLEDIEDGMVGREGTSSQEGPPVHSPITIIILVQLSWPSIGITYG